MVGGHRITIKINLKQIALNGIYILNKLTKCLELEPHNS